MNPEELLAYINDKAKLGKLIREYDAQQKKYARYVKGNSDGTNQSMRGFLVEFWPGYVEAVMQYEAALIHARGKFPDYLFQALSPLQEKEELEYLKSTYQATTKDVFIEFSNTAKKAIQNGNIEFDTKEGDREGNALKKYIFEDIDNFNSIVIWLYAMLDQKLIDANGIFAVWPEYSVDEEGRIIGETNPQPLIYNVDKIIWKNDGEYIVITSKKSANGGLVLRYFGREFVAQYNQVGKLGDFLFEETRHFEHEIGFTPAQELKGIAVLRENVIQYDSIFNIAVPHLNLAVIDSVTLLAIKKKVGYPTRVVMREKCKYQEGPSLCEGGHLTIYDGTDQITKNCPQCRGTGFIGVFGPMSELSILPNNEIGETSTGITAANAMSYVSPSTDIPKFLREEVEHHINRSLEVLHLKSQPRGSGDISATEKNRDKENTESFIKPISDQLWDIAAFVIECIGKMKFLPSGYESMKPKIIPAQSFDLLGADDYIAEMAEAKKSGVPEIVIQNIVYKYMNVIHHDDTISMRVFQLMEKSDRLLTMSNEQVAIAQSRGTVAPWEAVLHQSTTYIVHKAIMDYAENGKRFWDLEEKEQIALIQETAKQIVPVTETDELPPAIEP